MFLRSAPAGDAALHTHVDATSKAAPIGLAELERMYVMTLRPSERKGGGPGPAASLVTSG